MWSVKATLLQTTIMCWRDLVVWNTGFCIRKLGRRSMVVVVEDGLGVEVEEGKTREMEKAGRLMG
jgi:hypothetical protein